MREGFGKRKEKPYAKVTLLFPERISQDKPYPETDLVPSIFTGNHADQLG